MVQHSIACVAFNLHSAHLRNDFTLILQTDVSKDPILNQGLYTEARQQDALQTLMRTALKGAEIAQRAIANIAWGKYHKEYCDNVLSIEQPGIPNNAMHKHQMLLHSSETLKGYLSPVDGQLATIF